MGVPCPYSEPNWVSPVSAWASKWITDTRPHPTCRATPVDVGQGDGVVTAEHDRHGAGGRPCVTRGLQRAQRLLDLARRHLHVADVHHAELHERVDPEGQVRTGRRAAGSR